MENNTVSENVIGLFFLCAFGMAIYATILPYLFFKKFGVLPLKEQVNDSNILAEIDEYRYRRKKWFIYAILVGFVCPIVWSFMYGFFSK